jgi:hypothetical protein
MIGEIPFAVHLVVPQDGQVDVAVGALYEVLMRSEVIFRASEAIDNKYKLCQTAAKATRRFHIGSQEMNRTINDAFVKIAAGAHLLPLSEAA